MLDAPARIGLPIDPRIQARLVEVRRDGGRRRRRLLAVGASMMVLALLAWGGGRSPLLAVQHIELRGAGPTPGAVALAAAEMDHHHQMLDLSPGRMAARLEALPWVARAMVRRRWPATVVIALTSRVAVARIAGPDGLDAVVDAEGRVLATGPEAAGVLGRPGIRLPRLIGAGAAGPAGGVLAPGARPALLFVTTVPPALRPVAPPASRPAPGVDAVTASPDGNWSVLLSSGVSIIFGSPEQLDAKLVAMRTVLEREGPAGPATIDVRVPDTPVLTGGTRGTSVSTIARG